MAREDNRACFVVLEIEGRSKVLFFSARNVMHNKYDKK